MKNKTYLTGVLGIGNHGQFVKNSPGALDPRLLNDLETIGHASSEALRMYPMETTVAASVPVTYE
jgi:hypothetical protein